MTEEEHRYRPIDCDFHDRLLLHAMRGHECEIEARGPEGPVRMRGRIDDVYTRDGAEYARLTLGDGTTREIRLDYLLAVRAVPGADSTAT